MKWSRGTEEFLNKAGSYGSILELAPMEQLMEQLGHPERRLKIIHVAGTNGKGSVCCYIQNILTEAGYRVGMYTSPAVFTYEERFSVDGRPISEKECNVYMKRLEKASRRVESQGYRHPTVFEVETALAFLYFEEQKCDFVLIEVGMGGDCDATNVITQSFCSVFTSIGRDHMQFLGNSMEEIAAHKAGIIKENGWAVSIWQEKKVEAVLQREAKKKHCQIMFCQKNRLVKLSDNTFSYGDVGPFSIGMKGTFQAENAILALETILLLQRRKVTVGTEDIRNGLKKAFWPGRMECLSDEPAVYLDGAHNLPAALRLKETIETCFTNQSITYIIGVLEDKEHEKMLKVLLPLAKHIFVVTPEHSRAYAKEKLADEIRRLGYEAECESDLLHTALAAREKKTDLVLAFGSLSYLGQMKEAFLALEKENSHV